MPSKAQIDELLAECTWQWNSSGYLVTSKKNNKTLFLPAAGLRPYGEEGLAGEYWSRTLSINKSDEAYLLNFYNGHADCHDSYRYLGNCVRAVRVP